jgi:hypothetical protein
MTIRRAIFWSLFFATMPAVAFLSFDLVHVQEDFERYGAGVIPHTWWREQQPVEELDWRYKEDENWKTLRTLATGDDEFRAFRSPSRPWGNYEMMEGLMLLRQGRPVAHAVLSTDRRRLTSLIMPRRLAQSRPAANTSLASPSAPPKQVAQKNRQNQ